MAITVTEVLAVAMELTAEQREQLVQWMTRCVNAGIELEPASVRMSNDSAMAKLLGG